jgi:hypothetical protein
VFLGGGTRLMCRRSLQKCKRHIQFQ